MYKGALSHNISKLFRKLECLLLLLFLATGVKAQPPLFKVPAYVSHYADAAVEQMIEHKIPASVILAQAIFESNCGMSDLAKRSNNHFGIKCHKEWGGDTIVKTDDTQNECFRSYRSVSESFADHSLFLKSRSRYTSLFDLPLNDYKGWCRGLKTSGYATYHLYAEELIRIIETFNLQQLEQAEHLEKGLRRLSANEEIRQSALSVRSIQLRDIIKCDAIFIDPDDVLPQSMDFLAITDEAEELASGEGKKGNKIRRSNR